MTKKFRLAKGSLATFVAVTTVATALGGMTALQAQSQTYTCSAPGGFSELPLAVPPVVPPVVLASLKTVANPVIPKDAFGQPAIRADLVDYIANLTAAIRLGKALFWDMQAGSDNKTACATCHFKAGADGRDTNELNPGANGAWDAQGPNRSLTAFDFPFTVKGGADIDNVVGSQGVRKSTFGGITKSGESTTPAADPVFNVNGVNVRQVTGIQAPSVINAVFNHRAFWNGRAQPEFNGVNPFGARDGSARVWYVGPNGPTQIDIRIMNASLASQAVGPALNPVEMSASGRTFPDLGHKLFALKPLGLQNVDPTDSVLGSIADPSKGLTTTYLSMVQQAFKPKWWNTTKAVRLSNGSYTMAEANMSLFWGLSIMLYEATLVSDDAPIDRYLDPAGATMPRPALTNTAALNQVVSRLAAEGITVTVDDILTGLALFEMPAGPPPSFPLTTVLSSGQLGPLQAINQGGTGLGCAGCHLGAELTGASVRALTAGLEPGHLAFTNAGFDLRMEREFWKLNWTPPGAISPVPQGTDAITFDPSTYATSVIGMSAAPTQPPIPLPVRAYDAGWYNLGVRPTADNPGVDGTDPFGNSLSWTRLFQALPDPTYIKVPGATLGCVGMNLATQFPNELLNTAGLPLLSGSLRKTEETDVAGSFKMPTLRNIELTGPYFHNGGKATLGQVIEFYDDGGDFNNPTKHPSIVPLMLTPSYARALVAFLLSLTDERVRTQQAPFDHPSLLVPNGDVTPGTDNVIAIAAVGRSGNPLEPLKRFLSTLDPFYPIP
jgi:cytochrome c peroxidase